MTDAVAYSVFNQQAYERARNDRTITFKGDYYEVQYLTPYEVTIMLIKGTTLFKLTPNGH